MKTRNILLVCTLLLAAFTACNEESLMDDHTTETGVFSLTFSTNDVQATKAAASGFTYATEDEVFVSSCFVAVFKKADESLVYKKKSDVISTNGQFEIKDFILPMKTDLKVVAIANPTTEMDAVFNKSNLTYSDLNSLTTTTDFTSDAFSPKTLIKVGTSEIRFTGTGKKTPTIELTQLAARVDVDLEVKIPSLADPAVTTPFTLGQIQIKNVETGSRILPSAAEGRNPKSKKLLNSVMKSEHIITSFYTYAQPFALSTDLSKALQLSITGTAEGQKVDFTVVINPSSTQNGGSVGGILRGNLYTVTGKLTKLILGLKIGVNDWIGTPVEVGFK